MSSSICIRFFVLILCWITLSQPCFFAVVEFSNAQFLFIGGFADCIKFTSLAELFNCFESACLAGNPMPRLIGFFN